MARRTNIRAKAAIDPALRRQLLIVYEDACIVGERWNNAPIGTRESHAWSYYLAEQLVKQIHALNDFTRGRLPDAEAVRKVYQGFLTLRANTTEIGWDESNHSEARAVQAWLRGIEARLDQIIAGLRELIISFQGEGE